MMPWRHLLLPVAATALASCGRHDAAGLGSHGGGRYAGIGTFDAGRLWAQTAGEPKPSNPAAARLADDEHVIVVLDTRTGEVRECGDHSGWCARLDPWHSDASPLPLAMTKHAADLADDRAASNLEAADNAD